jgi:tetratricopeptide (TPR) repeat protein
MLDDKWGQSISLQYLGLMAARQGQLAAALARVAEGLAMARDEHDAWGMAAALALLGQILERQGDYEAAGAAYEESIGLIVDRLGDKATLAVALHGLGRLALRQGKAQRAAQWLAAAQALQAAAGGDTPLTLTTDEDLQQDLAEARAALPEADFEAGWQAGQALAQAPETWLGGSG